MSSPQYFNILKYKIANIHPNDFGFERDDRKNLPSSLLVSIGVGLAFASIVFRGGVGTYFECAGTVSCEYHRKIKRCRNIQKYQALGIGFGYVDIGIWIYRAIFATQHVRAESVFFG